MAKKDIQYRVSLKLAIQLIFVAGICDFIGLIPLVNALMVSLFWLGANYILKKHGVPLLNGRKLAAVAIDILIGFIPVLQELPEIILGIMVVLAIIYAEDKSGLKFIGKGGTLVNKNKLISSLAPDVNALNIKGVRLPNPQARPLNEGGVRQPPPQNNIRVLGGHSRTEAGNITKIEDIRPKEGQEPLELAA